MKEKCVISMQPNLLQPGNHESKAKAMKIAGGTKGVSSVAVIGEANDQLEVIGDGVNWAKLTTSITKKVCPTARIEGERVNQPNQQPHLNQQPNLIPVAQFAVNTHAARSCSIM